MRKVLELNGKTEILSLYSVILLFQPIALLLPSVLLLINVVCTSLVSLIGYCVDFQQW